MNTQKTYPVYTWHAAEVAAVQALAVRLLRNQEKNGPKDYTYFFMQKFCDRLKKVSDILNAEETDVARMDKDNRIFIELISKWLREHPEVISGVAAGQ